MHYRSITKEEWDKVIEKLLISHDVYASVSNGFSQDYELITSEDISSITYNKPKPVTSLKNFFLPVKENVTSERLKERPRMIIGIPNCDIEGMALLDEIYLDEAFNDIFYRNRRENTLLVASDCFGIQEHCHCSTYGIRPFSERIADIAVILLENKVILRIITDKGEEFIKGIPEARVTDDKSITEAIEKEHLSTESLLAEKNKGLPDYRTTGEIVSGASKEIWEKYSAHCVSCGACATICPTCTCFLLIDKPGFEKVKQLDACQYPGFEKVAGGEDGLFKLRDRFRNRYMCKYVWRPLRYEPVACTGCGRCIEACIGRINKNELFMELV